MPTRFSLGLSSAIPLALSKNGLDSPAQRLSPESVGAVGNNSIRPNKRLSGFANCKRAVIPSPRRVLPDPRHSLSAGGSMIQTPLQLDLLLPFPGGSLRVSNPSKVLEPSPPQPDTASLLHQQTEAQLQ